MTDKEIVERAKKAEKETVFGELVRSPISRGVNSAYGIGFIEGMVEYRNSLQEEPVSKDLEEAAIAFSKHFGEWDYAIPCFKEGAIWQKQQLKQQLMANAIDVEMKVDAGGYPYIDITIELYDYEKDIPLAKEGDKYSVILIKEG